MEKDNNFRIDALKMKEEIGKKFNELYCVDGKFDLDTFREDFKEMIRRGEVTRYSSVEEYETLVQASEKMFTV